MVKARKAEDQEAKAEAPTEASLGSRALHSRARSAAMHACVPDEVARARHVVQPLHGGVQLPAQQRALQWVPPVRSAHARCGGGRPGLM